VPVSTTTTSSTAATTVFPKTAVEARLRRDLLKSAAADAALKGITFPSGAAAQSAAAIQIDSLVVVSLLCAVEPALGMKLQDSVVKTGGYTSVNHAMEHLMPRIEKTWEKHESKGGKK
jgi:hypothetical protein